MTDQDIKQAKRRIEKLIDRHFQKHDHRDDMVQEAMIAWAAGETIYQAIATAKRAERSWTRAKRHFGEITLSNMEMRSLEAADQFDLMERREIAVNTLLNLLYMPINQFRQVTGHSVRWCSKLKQDIREVLDLPDYAGKWVRG